jgi:hypothetical protein
MDVKLGIFVDGWTLLVSPPDAGTDGIRRLGEQLTWRLRELVA